MGARLIESIPSRFSVAISTVTVAVAAMTFAAVPANALPASTNFGGGAIEGDVTFTSPGVPPVNTPCQPVSFSLTVRAVAVVSNSAGAEFAGVIGSIPLRPLLGSDISGSGSSTCENASVGGGTLNIAAFRARNPVTLALFLCTAMTGTYVRTLTDVTAVIGTTTLGGGCAITRQPTGRVAFVIRAEFAPEAVGAGLTTGITSARFAGTFTVVPASCVSVNGRCILLR